VCAFATASFVCSVSYWHVELSREKGCVCAPNSLHQPKFDLFEKSLNSPLFAVNLCFAQVVERDVHEGFIVATSYKSSHNHQPLAVGSRSVGPAKKPASPRAAMSARSTAARATAAPKPSREAPANGNGGGSARKRGAPQVRISSVHYYNVAKVV
jgi:hypothetical protein